MKKGEHTKYCTSNRPYFLRTAKLLTLLGPNSAKGPVWSHFVRWNSNSQPKKAETSNKFMLITVATANDPSPKNSRCPTATGHKYRPNGLTVGKRSQRNKKKTEVEPFPAEM